MDINIMFRSFPTISDNKMVSDRSRREYQWASGRKRQTSSNCAATTGDLRASPVAWADSATPHFKRRPSHSRRVANGSRERGDTIEAAAHGRDEKKTEERERERETISLDQRVWGVIRRFTTRARPQKESRASVKRGADTFESRQTISARKRDV